MVKDWANRVICAGAFIGAFFGVVFIIICAINSNLNPFIIIAIVLLTVSVFVGSLIHIYENNKPNI